MPSTTTREPIASVETYGSDCTSTGYDVEIYSDYAILVYHSCWQGDRPGTTYRATPPQEVMEAARREAAGEPHGHEPDLEAAVSDWLNSCCVETEFKLLRRGSIIR